MGKSFDMAALRAKHEMTRAVGNMNVNARGDILDSQNNIIQDGAKRVNTMYKKAMQSKPAHATNPAPVITQPVQPKIVQEEMSSAELDDIDDDIPNPVKDKK